jgi:hypothetical protein
VEPYPQHDAADKLVTAVTDSLSWLEWRSREGRLGTLSWQGIATESRATVWESMGAMDFGHGDGDMPWFRPPRRTRANPAGFV